VARYEEGCGIVRVCLVDMLEGEGRASKTRWNSIALGHTSVEIG